MNDALRKIIRRNRRQAPFRIMASAAQKYLRAFYNEETNDFTSNGERFALAAFAKWLNGRPCLTWDVGAYKGQWAREVHDLIPSMRVVSFEIIPDMAGKIAEEAAKGDWWRVEQVGVSDKEGVIDVTWNHSHDMTSSVAPSASNKWFVHSELDRIKCPVTTLDIYWRKSGEAPTLLKIDVEGHDWAVLAGGDALLASPDAPAMIQFEYGGTWIPSQRMLGPVQDRLEQHGYAVGRLYPNHVDFHAYSETDEHFRMGNMIAAKGDALVRMLAGK